MQSQKPGPQLESEDKPRRTLTPEEVQKRKRGNLVIALALLAFVVLVFAVTLAKLGANVLVRPI